MSRRIIICADGTWNTPDQRHGNTIALTNVCKIAQAIAPTDKEGKSQIVFYNQGVGTESNLKDHFLGGALGLGLTRNIISCYRFLVNNYQDGDELYLFGFSRGAYTVRSLAGLIRNCGILHKSYAELINLAYLIYRSRDKDDMPNERRAQEFRQRYSREFHPAERTSQQNSAGVNKPARTIRFIGVWDTVGSLGIPEDIINNWFDLNFFGLRPFGTTAKNSQKPDLKANQRDTFLQGSELIYSILHNRGDDSVQYNFEKPSPSTQEQIFSMLKDQGLRVPDSFNYRFHDVQLSEIVEHGYHALALDERRQDFLPTLWEKDPKHQSQILEQKWFVGSHCNVGGGEPDARLSDIPLAWMMEKAEGCGLAFDPTYRSQKIRPDAVAGSITDQLELNPLWKLPVLRKRVAKRVLFRQRNSCESVHESVEERIAKARPKYTPKNLTTTRSKAMTTGS